MVPNPKELSADQLRRGCDLVGCGATSTADLPQLEGIIGQERATRALEFGLDIPSYGFNVFAMGPTGAGKTTTIKAYLERKAAGEPVPDDWCYVNNFKQLDQPNAIRLPAHAGSKFRDAVDGMLKSLREEIPRAFEGEEYMAHRNRIARELDEQRKTVLKSLNEFVEGKGFSLVQTPMGLVIVPVINGEVVSPEQYDKLEPEVRDRLEAQRPDMQQSLEKTMMQVRELEKSAKEKLTSLDQDIAQFTVGHFFADIKAAFPHAEVDTFLDQAQEDLVQNIEIFKSRTPESQDGNDVPKMMLSRLESPYDRYRVNPIVDNCDLKGAPVVVEVNPTVHNLVGRIEHKAEFGALVTNFSMIKAGSLLRANGGYLVLDAKAVLMQPLAWESLKRCLRSQEVRVEELANQVSLIATTSLSPEPIPLNVKVVLVGDAETYYLLYSMDEQFSKLFKVRADFAVDMPWDGDSVMKYARFIRDRCDETHLPHFDMGAVAEVVEYGARLVENQKKLTTRFAEVADLVDESAYWASRATHELVTADDVQRAISERIYRASQLEERVREMIEDGTIMVDTAGEAVGQVNGLAIIALGDYMFGRPSRITAKVFMGQSGVINIEREAKMSGRIHDKGVLILAGYLGGKYAQDKPLSISASLAFEQNYEGIDGDSASSTELYALLSAISGLPIKQGLAVTGSVNQNGQVQPIGGVTRKIEGFFDVCVGRGLTGEQGVLIPQTNVRNLMLRHDVVAAVAEGKFHIYPVHSIDEGIAILTGREGGERGSDGKYPDGSVNAEVDHRLRELAELLRRFGDGEDDKPSTSANDTGRDTPAKLQDNATGNMR
jgi:lon-related putative ATP-dependent protease